jgi:hypothetical protein
MVVLLWSLREDGMFEVLEAAADIQSGGVDSTKDGAIMVVVDF